MLVRDIMTIGVLTCQPETSIDNLARLMLDNCCEEIIVLEEGHALGVVGQEELIKAYVNPIHSGMFADIQRSGFLDNRPDSLPNSTKITSLSLTARQIMREGVVQVPADIPVTAAVQLMIDNGVRTVFLMHHSNGIEYPAGYLSYWHVLRHLAAVEKNDLRDLGIYAERQSPIERFIQKRDAKRKSSHE
jgi:CBS domain-containing protein